LWETIQIILEFLRFVVYPQYSQNTTVKEWSSNMTKKTQNYLDEFTFRYNRRKSISRGLLFHRVMEQAAKHEPIMYSKISESHTGRKKYAGGKK